MGVNHYLTFSYAILITIQFMNEVWTPYLKRNLMKAHTREKKYLGPVLRISKERQYRIPNFSLVYISLQRNERLCVFIYEDRCFQRCIAFYKYIYWFEDSFPQSPNNNFVLAPERHKILFFGEKTSNLIVLLVFKEMQWILLVSWLACNFMKFRKKINVKETDCARETKINKRF